MFTARRSESLIASDVRAPRMRQTSTSSGSSDTDVTELAVMPCSSPSWTVVTTVTPVANWLMTLRNSIGSMRIRNVSP